MEANRHNHSVPPPQRRQIIVILVGAIILALIPSGLSLDGLPSIKPN